MNTKWTGYIGTYTKGESEGIYSFVLDTDKEEITNVNLVAKLNNPTYVATTKDNQLLYAVAKDGESGGVVGYQINAETHELKMLNKQMSEGSSPCYVATNSEQTVLVAAYYHRGTVESYTLNHQGLISERKSTIAHIGSGPNKERQEKPHAHYIDFTPNEKFVAAIDLGVDQLITYEVIDGQLEKRQALTLQAGCGPRHLTFHPNGRFAYLMTELSSEIVTLKFNQADGSFNELQYISTIPENFTENNQGSAIHISSDGKFVYASNRGHNSIAIFSVDQENGHLSLVDIVSSEGNWPRDFNFDPTENYLIGSNEQSHNLVLYKRDKSTGKLKVLQKDIKVGHPVCIKFLNK